MESTMKWLCKTLSMLCIEWNRIRTMLVLFVVFFFLPVCASILAHDLSCMEEVDECEETENHRRHSNSRWINDAEPEAQESLQPVDALYKVCAAFEPDLLISTGTWSRLKKNFFFLFHAARTQTWEPSTCEGSHIAAAVVWEKQHVRRYSRRYLSEGLAARRCAGTSQVLHVLGSPGGGCDVTGQGWRSECCMVSKIIKRRFI